MKNLTRMELKKVLGGQAIENSCGYTGQFYVYCKQIVVYGEGSYLQCWNGCASELTQGCSTDPNNFCVGGLLS